MGVEVLARIHKQWRVSLLDALLPLSLLSLAWERSGDPAVMVWMLALWCGLKFATRLRGQPLYGVLIGILLVCLSAILHPLTTSSPTDLVLILLAFAAGLHQSTQQWRFAFWMILAAGLFTLPFIEWDRSNGNLALIPLDAIRDLLPQEAIRIQRITINRSGYLFGLFSVVGYGLWRFESRPVLSRVAAAIGGLSALLAFTTGSRASFAFPFLAVLLCELCWRYRSVVARRARLLAGMLLAAALTFNLLLYLPFSPLAYRNASDAGRANVAQCFVAESFRAVPTLLSGRGFDRSSQSCRDITGALPGSLKGIPHAHNAFLQALGDQGLVTFILMIGALWVGLNRLLVGLDAEGGLISLVGLACTLFILFSSLVESTLIITSLQQVLTGYVLAVAWRPLSSHGQDSSNTISP